MAVSTERDPVATRAALADWLGRQTGADRRRGRRADHPGPVGVLERDAALRGHLGRGGPPAGDPRRADRPHRLPQHRLRRPGAGDAGARTPRAACRCPRCCGSRRAPTCSAPASCAWRGSRARCPPTTPATTARAGCRRSTRPASGASGRAGSTPWRRSTGSTAPAIGLGWIADVSPPSSSSSTTSTAPSRAATSRTPWSTAPSSSSRRASRRPARARRCAGATPASAT